MNIVDFFTGLGALMTALGVPTLLVMIVKHYLREMSARRESKRAFTSVFAGIHKVYYLLQILLNHSGAERIVLLKTTNGGGKPKLTGKLYSSVIYEVFKNPLVSVKDRWQKQVLDHSYMEMLYEMNKAGFLVVDTKERIGDSQKGNYVLTKGVLKTLYLNDNIVESWVYKIAERENEYIYLSANYSNMPEMNAAKKDLFRHSINSLRILFEKNNKI